LYNQSFSENHGRVNDFFPPYFPLIFFDLDEIQRNLPAVNLSIGAPLLGNMEERSFLRSFGIKIYIKMSCKRLSLSIGTPLRNLVGFRLPGHFERKGKCIWLSFLDPEDIKILSLGAIWNSGKGTGLC
jgi:hypothetical protein